MSMMFFTMFQKRFDKWNKGQITNSCRFSSCYWS